jgi:hypothetical protein
MAGLSSDVGTGRQAIAHVLSADTKTVKFSTIQLLFASLGTVIGIGTWLLAGRDGVRIPVVAGDISLLRNVQAALEPT